MDQEHRFLTLNINDVACQNAILDFVQYAVTAALLAIPGFPASVASLVARALIKSIPVAVIVGAIDVLISKPIPTPADFASAFGSIIAILTTGGYLTPDKVRWNCVGCLSTRLTSLQSLTSLSFYFLYGRLSRLCWLSSSASLYSNSLP